jgi:hypothetical protein
VGAHDIGKIAPCFQAKDRSGVAQQTLTTGGFDFPVGNDVPHGIISTRILTEALAEPDGWPAIPLPLARRVAVTIGGHHGTFPRTIEWDLLEESTLGNDRWHRARLETLKALAQALAIP